MQLVGGAGPSRASAPPLRRRWPRPLGWLALLPVGWAGAVPAQAQITQEESLRLAFPAPATIERKTAFLSPQDLAAVRKAAGADVAVDQSVVTYYVGTQGGKPLGVAYFDVHRVRTEKEVLMIVVRPDGRLGRIEVLRFAEPPDYKASDEWLAQFRNKGLSDDLSLKKAIVNLSGATLTSHAVLRASRRVLALHGRIQPLR